MKLSSVTLQYVALVASSFGSAKRLLSSVTRSTLILGFSPRVASTFCAFVSTLFFSSDCALANAILTQNNTKKINDFFFKNGYQQLLWEKRQVQNVKLQKKNIQKQRYGHLWAVAGRGDNVGEN